MNRKARRAQEAIHKKLEHQLPVDYPHRIQFDPRQLQAYGPIIGANILVASAQAQKLTAEGHPVPPPVPCRLLIDTGATATVVKHEIAEKAGLSLVNASVPAKGIGFDPTGRLYFGRVLVRFDVNHKGQQVSQDTWAEVLIQSAKFDDCPHMDGVLGRDVLSFFDMTYSGPTGLLTLRYKGPRAAQ